MLLQQPGYLIKISDYSRFYLRTFLTITFKFVEIPIEYNLLINKILGTENSMFW